MTIKPKAEDRQMSKGGVCEVWSRQSSGLGIRERPHESYEDLDFSFPISISSKFLEHRPKTDEERKEFRDSIKRMRIGVCVHCRSLFRPE